ncbi:YqeG family HAD IIIA-type phosphatase [Paenibacillus hodogayensis]|uniref:YqeG family HAD IIIA-type phosphatase n=1 Tax=Paenibacillus hodogayensis TaxID=279208 RepID=A0ABV5VUS4_9BACL
MLKKLIPQKNVRSIYEIDVQALWSAGVRGIITDLDNTLVGAKHPEATPELLVWLEALKTMGFKVVIVSNNNRLRVSRFSDPLSIPYIFRAKKPGNTAFRRALGIMELAPEQTVVIGDQMLTDVLGGNRLGLYTILVTPIAPADEGFFTKVNRRVEKAAISWMKRKGLMQGEDSQHDKR